jgi:hypothetical protein
MVNARFVAQIPSVILVTKPVTAGTALKVTNSIRTTCANLNAMMKIVIFALLLRFAGNATRDTTSMRMVCASLFAMIKSA